MSLVPTKVRSSLINLAILPSSASNIASNIKVTAKLKLPSIENFIELIPKQTPANVNVFGNKYLVFDETNLNFLFSSIVLKLTSFLPTTF